jgi:hypothetical protein
MSITATEISTTTPSKISSAYQEPPTPWSIGRRVAGEQNPLSILHTLPSNEITPRRGTPPPRVRSGIDSTQPGRSQKTDPKSLASSVGDCSNQKSPAQQCVASSANAQGGLNTSAITGVPVYDLMVEGEHEFFAYGVLVHNCVVHGLSFLRNLFFIEAPSDEEETEETPEAPVRTYACRHGTNVRRKES